MVEKEVKVAPWLRTRKGLGGKKVLEVSVHSSLQTGPPCSHATSCGASSRQVLTISRDTGSTSSATGFAFPSAECLLGCRGGDLDGIHDVKAMLLLSAMQESLQKLLMGGLPSSFPANTGHCLAKEACPETQPRHLVAKAGVLQGKKDPQARR